MKRTVFRISLALAIVVLVACEQANEGPPVDVQGDSVPPAVNLNSPSPGAELELGASVESSGVATDDRGVVFVELLVDGVVVAGAVPDGAGRWSYRWQAVEVGVHELIARAYDAAGNAATSEPITVTVLPAADPDPPTDPLTGTVVGTIGRTGLAAAAANAAPLDGAAAPARVVPGEVFLFFPDGARGFGAGADLSLQANGALTFEGVSLAPRAHFPAETGLTLYAASGLDEAATLELVRELGASGTGVQAFPNWILEPQAQPNDPRYADQWHYQQVDLPRAWDVETGASNRVTVAVLDSGRLDHPEIVWADGGANFVNWNGMQPDPAEGPITNPYTNAAGSAHGTHVAGTVGAVTDNAGGVAGVNWHTEVLPVKVLSEAGPGSLAGVLEGVLWAAGHEAPEYGGHLNASPARIINLSLGADTGSACPAPFDDVFALVAERYGAVTIASAGNEAAATGTFFPANCPSVITVGAVGPSGTRASYSNYGPEVDVMAPGGDLPGGSGSGVLSLGFAQAAPDYRYAVGTSMAAPHVSGIVSLMLAREPTLTPAQVRGRLVAASLPLTAEECRMGGACGAGIVDAHAAVLGVPLDASAVVYALPYDGSSPPQFDLDELATTAPYRVEATELADGRYRYGLEGLEPGTYTLVGLELHDAAYGVSSADRVGFVDSVTVEADTSVTADLLVQPIYQSQR